MRIRNLLQVAAGCIICAAFMLGCNVEVTQTAANVAPAPDFTSANFKTEVLESSKVVLVDCWASW